jgi:hypothetical protein
MHNYQLKLPYEFEAFQLGIELEIIQYASEDSFTKRNNDNDEIIIYNIDFDDEDEMYAFDKTIREKLHFIYDKK